MALSKPLAHAQEDHGYDVILTSTAKQGLLCSECMLILRDAVQTSDGVRLCDPCFKQIARLPQFTSLKTNISVADEDGKPSCYPDKAVRREVLALEVFCNNKKFGCDWNGILGKLGAHLLKCQFTPVRCTNEGCDKLVRRDKLKDHLENECDFSEVPCKYCGTRTLRNKLDDHFADCSQYPVPCENCGQRVIREKMDHHNIHECDTVKCSCSAVLKRNAPAKEKNSVLSHLAKPAEVLYHILSISALLNNVIKSNENLDSRLSALENGSLKQSSKAAQREEIAQYRAEIEQSFWSITDRLAPLEQYQAELQMASRDKNLAMRVSDLQKTLKKYEAKSNQQEAQIQSLKTQLQQRQVTSSLTTSSELNVDGTRLVTVEKRYEELEKQVSMLKVHVSELELQLQASLASTHNGCFLWRIPDVARRRRDAIEERITSIYSPPFYTGRNGYKMCIRAYLNGDGMGYKTHLSLFFVVMKGEFDALLKWPFDYKVSLIMVDQNHRKHIVQTFKPTVESNSFQRPVSDMNVASGCPQFAKLSVLDDEAYVKDDVLFVKCIVDTTRIFHP